MRYELIDGGYRILRDNGDVVIVQDYDPTKPFVDGAGQPFDSEAAAIADAEAFIAMNS